MAALRCLAILLRSLPKSAKGSRGYFYAPLRKQNWQTPAKQSQYMYMAQRWTRCKVQVGSSTASCLFVLGLCTLGVNDTRASGVCQHAVRRVCPLLSLRGGSPVTGEHETPTGGDSEASSCSVTPSHLHASCGEPNQRAPPSTRQRNVPVQTNDWRHGAHVGGYSVVIDVRTPSEYAEDHISGAVNFPVLTDAQRHEVLTCLRANASRSTFRNGVGEERRASPREPEPI